MSATATNPARKIKPKAQQVALRVQKHWDEQHLPLGYRQALACVTLGWTFVERERVERYLTTRLHMRISNTTNGSRYIFPDMIANEISEDEVLHKLAVLDRLRRQSKNQARFERTHGLREDLPTPLLDHGNKGQKDA